MSHTLEFKDDDWHIVSDSLGVFVAHHPCEGAKRRDIAIGKVPKENYPYSWMPAFAHLQVEPRCNWCYHLVPEGVQALTMMRMMEKN